MNEATTAIVSITAGITGLALMAVLVSQKSNTANVLSAFGNAFSNMLSAATAPVTGAATAPVNSSSGIQSLNFGGLGSFSIPGIQ